MVASTPSGKPDGGHVPTPAIRQYSEPPDLSRLHLLPYEEFCEAADHYELHLRNTIARLREMRNDRSPHAVQRLPTELLIQIFNNVSLISDPRSSRSLIALTHVCRRWRSIALDIPEPWSSIVVTSLSSDGVLSFIERSRDSLLNIRLQDPRLEADFRFLSSYQSRLRSLIVEARGLGAAAQATKQLTWRRSPHLETLCILGPGASSRWTEILGLNTTCHPPNKDEAATTTSPCFSPSLRYLHLRPMVIPWTSGVYSNLSVLDLDTSRLTGLTEGRLVSILRRCPELVELHLRVEGDLKGSKPPDDGSWDVALPLLSVFSVEGLSPELAASVLSHLTLPAFTRYTLSLCSKGPSISPFIAALPPDRRRLPGLAAITGLTLKVADNGNTHVTLSPAHAPTVPLTLTDESRNMMLPCIPTAAFESLEVIKTRGPLSSRSAFALDWHAVFCRLPRLRLLLFYRPIVEDLAYALDALGRPGGNLPHTLPFPCPALECLELVSLSLTRDLGDRLANASRMRSEWGFSPLSLKVRDVIGEDDAFFSRLCELDVNVVERSRKHAAP